MNDDRLYELPGDRSPLRSYVKGSVVALLATFGLISWVATQYMASHLAFQPQLGPPWWPWSAGQAKPALYVATSAAALAALFLLHRRLRRATPLLLVIALGAFALSHGPLYSPAHYWSWSAKWRSYPPVEHLFAVTLRYQLFAATAALLVWVASVVAATRRLARKPDTHGSARWADSQDLQESGLEARAKPGPIVDVDGIILGLWERHGRISTLSDAKPHHVFCFAPTRSGKGVGLVIPNLLNWRGSVIVNDIKGENWARTAGWRRRAGSLVVRFDPTYHHEGASATPRGAARYNPLLEIRDHPYDVRDAQNIADILVDPNGDRVRDHWDRTAHALLTGVILFVHHVYRKEPERATLRQCAAILADASRGPASDAPPAGRKDDDRNRVLLGLRDTTHLPPDRQHDVIVEIMNAMIAKAPNEQSGVISTALAFLDLYRDPLIADNTSTSDFRIADIMNHERPVSLYLTVPPSDISRTRPLIRLLLNQLCRRLTESLDHDAGHSRRAARHELLLMLDEFPALGKMPFFQDSLAYLAGYGIRAFLITQDLSQHQGVYGKEESITANCHARIAFTPNKPETAELLSRMTGEMTVHQDKRTRQLGGALLDSRVSVSQAETRRRLLTMDEAMRLPDTAALVYAAGCRPIYGRKLRYYEDAELARRAAMPAPRNSDLPNAADTPHTAPTADQGDVPPTPAAGPPARADSRDQERSPAPPRAERRRPHQTDQYELELLREDDGMASAEPPQLERET